MVLLLLLSLSSIESVEATSSAASSCGAPPQPSRRASWKSALFASSKKKRRGLHPTLKFRTALSTSIQHQKLETQVGKLANEFVPVIRGRGLLREIDVVRLLHAAHHYTTSMRQIGQSQSAQDMERNIEKARALVRTAPRGSTRHNLQALLEYEKNLGIHGPHGHLKDPSGAVGFLWIRRSLAYQYRMFELVLERNLDPPTAAAQAYRTELQPYHGWTLQQVYTLAMKTLTPSTTEAMLAKVGGFDDAKFGPAEDQATRKDLQRLLNAWRPLLARWKQIYVQLDLEDPRRH